MKAVIVDIRGRWAAALGEDGAIVRIANAAYVPGQTIELLRTDARRTPRLWKKAGSLAAAAALVLSIGAGTAYALPCGTVSLDGESSLAYTINCFDYVLDVQAADEESAALLEEIGVKTLRHHRIDTALRRTVEQLESTGCRSSDDEPLRITADTQRPGHDEKLHAALEEALRRSPPSPAPAESAREAEPQTEPDTPPSPSPQELRDETAPSDAGRPAPTQPENGAQPPEPEAAPAGMDGGALQPPGAAPHGEQPAAFQVPGAFRGSASPEAPPPQP